MSLVADDYTCTKCGALPGAWTRNAQGFVLCMDCYRASEARNAETLPAPPPTQRSGEGLSQLHRMATENEACQRWYDQQRAAMNARAGMSLLGLNRRVEELSAPAETPTLAEWTRQLEETSKKVEADFNAWWYGDARPLAEPAEPPLTAERLARALFDVDEEVRSFAARTSECLAPGTDMQVGRERWQRVMDIAWERNELGARTRWTAIATAAVERLRGGR